ncbi:bestrophin family ion channel [Microcoleus sp. FACHB-68]|uniref:bestrophin family protein n=1 Tax=Microcoleus sp. FACHB-68 TaxID=2692826 RepID=UPI0016876B50|nr:bestrophin family ion channel [Microcoleus sp. FACHB-68]MBD1936599.1 hypothetical protein [Microcoleus sp. FACHB-68]
MQWFKLALQLRGSVAPTVFPRVVLCGVFGFLVSLIYYYGAPVSWDIFGSVVTNVVFNLVLGLLLVFRTNTAYERFWEGRKIWGVIVINARNLARQIWVGVSEVEPADRENKASVLKLLVAFAIATKLHLRKEPVDSELEARINPAQTLKLKKVKNPPLEVALWIGNYLQQQQNRGCLTSNQLRAMNKLLDSMVEALTGCERISRTPIPLAYSIYLKRLLLIYGLILPFQIVDKTQWYTGLIVALISFILLGIEEIGNEIENPFGYDPNDLPLDEICNTISNNIEDLIVLDANELSLVDNWQTTAVE